MKKFKIIFVSLTLIASTLFFGKSVLHNSSVFYTFKGNIEALADIGTPPEPDFAMSHSTPGQYKEKYSTLWSYGFTAARFGVSFNIQYSPEFHYYNCCKFLANESALCQPYNTNGVSPDLCRATTVGYWNYSDMEKENFDSY